MISIKRKLFINLLVILQSFMGSNLICQDLEKNLSDSGGSFLTDQTEVFDSCLSTMISIEKINLLEKDKKFGEAIKYIQNYRDLLKRKSNDNDISRDSANILLEQQLENKILMLQNKQERRKTIFVLVAGILAIAVISGVSIIYISQLRQKNRLEAALAKIQQQQFQAVIEAQDQERKRIASDLHDSVGQMLSLTKLNMTDLLDSVSQHKDYNKLVEKTIRIVDDACTEVREISHNLMPGSLIRLGFVAATKDLIRKLNQNKKFSIDFIVEKIDERLNEKIEVALYRIIQEILNNAIKHSKASKINIVLGKEEGKVVLSVWDNGVGFDTEKINYSRGIGWKNIYSRLSVINGHMQVDSSPGNGVHINIEVPFQSNKKIQL